MLTNAKEKIPMARATSVSVKADCLLGLRIREGEVEGVTMLSDRRLMKGMASGAAARKSL